MKRSSLFFMDPVSIFSGISENEREKMIGCFNPIKGSFMSGECIMTYSSEIEQLGILLSGNAQVIYIDSDGRKNISESLDENDVFGEIFCLPLDSFEYYVEAETDCEVLFVEYRHVIKQCSNACEHHSRLVNNLFQMTAKKAQSQAIHINVLSQRGVRQKLKAYFEFSSAKSNSNTFTLPMSYTSLSEYISVDRSAMMRELKKMKDEQIILSKGRKITIMKER